MGEDIIALFLILVGSFEFLTIKSDVSSMVFVEMLFIKFSKFSIPGLLRVFVMNEHWGFCQMLSSLLLI